MQSYDSSDRALILHSPSKGSVLSSEYHRAFREATEPILVTAYLTEWDSHLRISPKCKKFRFVVGKDFGITRIAACRAVLRWLPRRFKGEFLVASKLSGFHPKAVFWREAEGNAFAIVGSSNLTRAAFKKNYEANVRSTLSSQQFEQVKAWLTDIEEDCDPVSPRWLSGYKESKLKGYGKKKASSSLGTPPPRLPSAPRTTTILSERRSALRKFAKHREGLLNLFRRCASGNITSPQFYERLPHYWSWELGDRLQGKGFTIKGKHSDFSALSRSVMKIVAASDSDRDAVVSEQIDELRKRHVPTRRALLSEMLCLLFPDKYPLLNTPVLKFRSAVGLRKIRGTTEGADYIFLSRTLRRALRSSTSTPAKNLAELDALIWAQYGRTQ